MSKNAPLDQEKQVPILKGILATIKLHLRLGQLPEFVASPEFKKEIGLPLETIVKFRSPGGRVSSFSQYLTRMSRSSHSNRRKMAKSPTLHQLINQMEEASSWNSEDNQKVNEEWLSLKAHLKK